LRVHPLDDPELQALEFLDLKAARREMPKRLASDVISVQTQRQGLDQPQHCPDRQHRAADVLK
jgi:hypothetical protein